MVVESAPTTIFMAPKKAELVAGDKEARFGRRIELKFLKHKECKRLCFELFAADGGKWKVWLFSSDPAQRIHEIVSAVDLELDDIPESFKAKLLAREYFVPHLNCVSLLPWHARRPCCAAADSVLCVSGCAPLCSREQHPLLIALKRPGLIRARVRKNQVRCDRPRTAAGRARAVLRFVSCACDRF